MSDHFRKDIIALVKSAILGKGHPLSDEFSIEDALAVAKKHQIQSLVYYGAVHCGVDTSNPAMKELFMALYQNILISERQMQEVDRVCSALGENGIDHMPLKGTLLKKLYPKSEMRVMGDADILIKTENYDAIKPLMLGLGFEERVESDHELIWRKPELFLELHKRLIPSYNRDYYAYYGDGWRLARPCEGVPHRFEMSNEDQMIYLFTHFSKHYRDGGIGIRHLTDLYVYRKANPGLDEEYIRSEIKKLSLYDFYINIIHTIAVWFEDAQPDPKTELITEYIFDSGVYGRQSTRVLAQTVKTSQKSSSIKNAKLKRMLEMAFPSLASMTLHYAFLQKYPFLLPVTWIMRLFKVAFFKTDRAKAFYNNMQGMSSQDITDYHQALQYVGLEFNFKE